MVDHSIRAMLVMMGIRLEQQRRADERALARDLGRPWPDAEVRAARHARVAIMADLAGKTLGSFGNLLMAWGGRLRCYGSELATSEGC